MLLLRFANEDGGDAGGRMDLGNVSTYTCPECHGVLMEFATGKVVRFRWHIGHAGSPTSSLIEVNDAIDKGPSDDVPYLVLQPPQACLCDFQTPLL